MGIKDMGIGRLLIAPLLALPLSGAQAAPLSPSTFESDDGDMLISTAGNKDWENAPNLSVGDDQPSGSFDDSFGQGTKEDSPVPTVVNGSIPNNKSDLTHLYVSSEVVSNQTFLYLAWTRANTLGTANIDFEFNQSRTLSGNGVTPVRTAGDLLVTFDFNGGGDPTKVALGLLTWITDPADVGLCQASNSVPCWGDRKDLSAAGFANGAVNIDPTPIDNPISGGTQPQLTFGEAAINLTGAGILGPNDCNKFATVYAKSRSSSSFTAATKDFIAPIPLQFQACKFTVITLVCKQGGASSTLYSSTVTLDGGSATSSLSTPPAGLTESQLCGLGGARFQDLNAGNHSSSITIPNP